MAANVIPLRRHLRLVAAPEPQRPRTRGECADVPRPCPWRTCEYNLRESALRGGGVVTNDDPDLSCVLDVADRGGVQLEVVSNAIGLTRERIRQIEEKALRRLQRRPGDLRAWDEGGGDRTVRGNGTSRTVTSGPKVEEVEEVEDGPDAASASFFDAPPAAPPAECALLAIRDDLRARDSDDDEPVPYWRDVPGFVATAPEPEPEPVADAATEATWRAFARSWGVKSKASKASTRTLARVREAKGETVLPPRTPNDEEPMNGTTTNGASAALSQKQKATLTIYNQLRKSLGRVPMATEIATKLDIGAAAARYQIGQLAEMGLAEIAPRGGARRGTAAPPTTKLTIQSAAPPAATAAAVRGALVDLAPTPPPRTTSSDPVVAALTEKRDGLLARAAALTAAIEALSVAP